MSATAAPAKPASLWEDFIDIFYAPSSVFDRRRDGKFGVALLVLTVLAAVIFFTTKPLMEPLIDRTFQQQIAQMQARGMSAQQIEQARPMMERIGSASMNVAGLVGMPLLVFISAFVLWLVAKLFDSRASYGQVAMVATYANVPRVVGGILGGVVLLLKDPTTLPPVQQLTFSPALLLGPDDSPVLAAFLSRLDLFGIWAVVLSGIGIAVVGRTSVGKGIAAAALVWLLATLMFVAQTWSATA